MPDYKVVRRWYTVQRVKADSKDEAVMKAQEDILLGEDFHEEGYKVEKVKEQGVHL